MAGHHDVSYLKPHGDYGDGGIFSGQFWKGFATDAGRWIYTVDHKKIGVMYLAAVLLAFFLGGVFAIAVRLELWEPTHTVVVNPETGEEYAPEAAPDDPNLVTETRGVVLPNIVTYVDAGTIYQFRPDGGSGTAFELAVDANGQPSITTGEGVDPGRFTVVEQQGRVWEIVDNERRVTAGEVRIVDGEPSIAVAGDWGSMREATAREEGTPIVANNVYNRMFTLHGTIMVFLFIIPSIPAALGNIFLPIMLGAKDVAFPRLNLFSWYIYVFGGLFALWSLIGGGVETGWTFYTPYSTTTDWGNVTAMVLAAFILGFSSIFTGMNFIVTVHKLRVPGMGWFDMPLFIWALYATSIIQVLATPVLGITLLMIVFERVFKVGIFDPALGGDPVLFQHFFWFYSHPAVYIMILPAFGIISEIITVHARKRIFGYRAIAFSSIAIAAISFLVWAHHMFTSASPVANVVFSALTFLVAIPTAIKVFNWVATYYKGSIQWTTPMLYVAYFLFCFTIGGLTGPPLATLSTDIHLHDTYFVVAHFHYVMMGGTVLAFVGGLHHWWPKFTGRMYNEPWAKIGSWLVFLGFNLTFFIQFFLGTQGMPRRYSTYIDEFTMMHQISTLGSWLLLVGFLIHLAVFIQSLAAGRRAPQNPWGGLTLEWYADSPPLEHNFAHEPVLTHGPYDYDRVVPPGVDPADYPLPDPDEVNRVHGGH